MIAYSAENKELVTEKMKEKFADSVLQSYEENGHPAFDILGENAAQCIQFLRDTEKLNFSFFLDLTAVDYSEYGQIPGPAGTRYGVVYLLLSPSLGLRVKIRALISGDTPRLPSVSTIFAGANWAEREVFDLYGIEFEGHPNLKRLLLPDDYEGHPLRKDYPLRGRGERSNFEVYQAFTGH